MQLSHNNPSTMQKILSTLILSHAPKNVGRVSDTIGNPGHFSKDKTELLHATATAVISAAAVSWVQEYYRRGGHKMKKGEKILRIANYDT